MTTTQPTAPASGMVTIARFDSYAGAQHLVDRLSDERFPVETVRIVGNGIRSVEDVTGRLTKGRAALYGAPLSAAMLLLHVGFLVVLAVVTCLLSIRTFRKRLDK